MVLLGNLPDWVPTLPCAAESVIIMYKISTVKISESSLEFHPQPENAQEK